MNQLNDQDLLPWYKQFWPWFLIALPGTVVVAALSTVFIAFYNADSEINDSYFSDGMGINQILDEDVVATELKITATLIWDKLTGEVLLDLTQLSPPLTSLQQQENPQQLALLLSHPVDEDKDQIMIFSQSTGNRYRADFNSLPQHRYYLRLSPLGNEQTTKQWRLQGEINFSQSQRIELRYR